MTQETHYGWLARLSIGKKFACVLALFTVAIGGMLFSTMTAMQAQTATDDIINLAGRQRMLNQRYMKEVLLTAEGVQSDYAVTHGILAETLHSLTEGGTVSLGDGKTVQLPPASSTTIREQLQEQAQLISAFSEKADDYIQGRRPDQRQELLELNGQIQTAANRANASKSERST